MVYKLTLSFNFANNTVHNHYVLHNISADSVLGALDFLVNDASIDFVSEAFHSVTLTSETMVKL